MPHKSSNFDKKIDEDECGHGCKKEEDSDIDDEGIKDTLTSLTLEIVALKNKQLLKGIQEESLSGGLLLMQHKNVILKRLHTDVRNLRRSNVIQPFHSNVYVEQRQISLHNLSNILETICIFLYRRKKTIITMDE